MKVQTELNYIKITTRDQREFKLMFIKKEDGRFQLPQIIEKNAFFSKELKDLKNSYAYKFKLDNPEGINGWLAPGDVISELAR